MKSFIPWLATGILSLGVLNAHANQDFPQRPVTLVVTSTPGSPLDILGRLLAHEASKNLNQTVIVENRPGASGNVGGSYVARSAPDGHTVMLTLDNQATVNPQVMKETNFNALTDLEHIARIGRFSQVLVVPRQLGVDNLEAFFKLAKERDLTYASAGVGSPGHLTMAAMADAAGLTMTHVPYKGNPPAVNDMLAGLVDTGFLVVSGVLPHIESGAFVPLAVSGSEPNALLPNVPTVASTGLPGTENFQSYFSYLVAAPKGTPEATVAYWRDLLQDIVQRPEVAERLRQMDIEVVLESTEATQTYLHNEAQRWAEVIKAANIRID